MSIPTFSVFSALSEILVTAGVLFIIRRNWTRRRFSLAFFLVVALFEASVNVMYMASRAAQAGAGAAPPLAPGLKLAYAGHGILSLLAYLVFVMLGVFAWQDQRNGRYLFRERPAMTWTFLAVWLVSVASGEGIFLARYVL
ncbi:MAG TPA: hypothetical protein VMS88_07515 [Terriglobales bacterium]|nr:hypothetical protein [Terriglobales bacterium]